ncbi:unnamed protein product [Closterium sp. Naga37s-1]|nr:unnamed protein product [Closterium sp. Naga37s-1]
MAAGRVDLKWVRRRVTEALLVSGAVVACLVNHHVPHPYMDEIFHVPQTQQYCRGDLLTWHPLITTLPGLATCSYYLALVFVGAQYAFLQLLGIVKTAAHLASTSDARSDATSAAGVSFASLCSPVTLRSLNLLLLVLSFPLFYSTARAAAAAAAAASAAGASDAAGATVVAARSKKAGSKPHSRPRGVAALLHRYETRYDTRDETQDDTRDETQDEAGNDAQADTKSRPPVHAPWDEVDEDCTWRAAMFVLFPLHCWAAGYDSTCVQEAALPCRVGERSALPGFSSLWLAAGSIIIRQTNAVWALLCPLSSSPTSPIPLSPLFPRVFPPPWQLAASSIIIRQTSELAAGSIIIRQTNAVWALLALCLSASHFLAVPVLLNPQPQGTPKLTTSLKTPKGTLKDEVEKQDAEKDKAERDEDSRGRADEHGTLRNGLVTNSQDRSFQDPSWATGAAVRGEEVPRALLLLMHRAWAVRGNFLRNFFPLLAVLAAFFVFVRVNGGIVVGARTEHRLSPHLMQPLYFAAFSALSLSPLLLAPSSLLPLLSTTSHSLRSSPGRCLVLSLLASALLFLTIKHFRYSGRPILFSVSPPLPHLLPLLSTTSRSLRSSPGRSLASALLFLTAKHFRYYRRPILFSISSPLHHLSLSLIVTRLLPRPLSPPLLPAVSDHQTLQPRPPLLTSGQPSLPLLHLAPAHQPFPQPATALPAAATLRHLTTHRLPHPTPCHDPSRALIFLSRNSSSARTISTP